MTERPTRKSPKKREETAKLINDLKKKESEGPVQVNSGLDAIDSANP